MARKLPPESLSELTVWNLINDPISTYETKKTYLDLWYRDDVDSFVGWLRHYTNDHAEQREHAGGIRL
jgi:hypothetical protein